MFAFCDFKAVRRAMARTPGELARLTRDGLIYDHVHYRWNREAVEDVLDAGDRHLPAGLRTPGTAMVLVSIRVWDDDVDMIEIFDPETGSYHGMWSTEPEYTSGLSRWEHHQYREMIRAGKGGAVTEESRLLAKGRSLIEGERDLPSLPFRERATAAALTEAEGYRRASGARARRPGFAEVPELGLEMTPGGEGRLDRPTSPPQPSRGGRAGRKGAGERTAASRRAPRREKGYGQASLPREPSSPASSGSPAAPAGSQPAREAKAARLARWTALAERVGSSDEEELMDGSEYRLRQDEDPGTDETGDSVAYDDEDESEDPA